jgi:RNA polymerase sigma factor (sigma-70 family)
MAIQARAELVQAVKAYQAGKSEAFDTIYYESAPYITTCVLNVLNKTVGDVSEDLQQDILQDTYLTIAQKLWELNEPAAFLQWAGRIATHTAQRTWQKDAKRQSMEVCDTDMTLKAMDEAFIPEDALMNREAQEKIRALLDELPTNQYLCVVEYFYNDLKEREIADKLNMPVNSVKTNLSRAKKKLRAVIETKVQAAGIQYRDMAWLLLLLLQGDVHTLSIPAAQHQRMLSSLHAELGYGAVAAGISASASGGASAGASSSASASAAVAGAATKTAATKVAAIALAGILTAGAAVGIPLATRNRQLPAPEPTPNTWQIPEDAFHFDGHSYYIYEQQTSWDEAQAFCENLGGHLAVITSDRENAALYQYLTDSGCENAYIGLYEDEEGQWHWVTAEETVYLNWAPGEPNNESGTEKYAMFYYKFQDGTWNDGNFGQGTQKYSKTFLCEWEGEK